MDVCIIVSVSAWRLGLIIDHMKRNYVAYTRLRHHHVPSKSYEGPGVDETICVDYLPECMNEGQLGDYHWPHQNPPQLELRILIHLSAEAAKIITESST